MREVLHIQEIGNTFSSLEGDAPSSAEVEFVSYGRCEIFMRDEHPSQESSSFSVRENSHSRFPGYVTLLTDEYRDVAEFLYDTIC
jgi:hypothetical protein